MGDSMKSKVMSGLAWKFGERILAQVVTLVVSICLARILSPDDYGVVAMAMIVITVADVFVTSGFGNSLIQKKEADQVDFSTMFHFNVFFSVALYIIIFIASPCIAVFFGNKQLALIIRVLAIRIPIAAVNSIQQAYVSRNMMFKRFFWSTLFGTLLSGIVGIAMALCGFGIWALVAQYLTNALVDTLVLWFTVRWRPTWDFSYKRLIGLFSYGWKIVLSGVINTIFIQYKNLIIGKKYTEAELAYYTNGDMYPQALTSGINTTISSVLFPALSQCQDDKIRLKEMTRKAVRISSYIMWPVMLGFATVAPALVDVVLTEKWMPCVVFIQLACVAYAFYPVHTANLEAIKAIGRSDVFLKLEVVKKSISLVAVLISMNYGPLAIASCSTATTVVCMFINAYPNIKLLGYTICEQLSDFVPSMLKALVMSGVVYAVGRIQLSSAIVLGLQIIVGVATYIIISVLTKDKQFLYIKNIVYKK